MKTKAGIKPKRASTKSKMSPSHPDRSLVQVVAPSSVLSGHELELGVGRLLSSGLEVRVDAQCLKRDLFFAGSDSDRARSLIRAIRDSEVGTIWSGRGGYGAARLLLALRAAFPKKSAIGRGRVYVGYSDSTALFSFLNTQLGFSILHAPMPGLRSFCRINEDGFERILSGVLGESPELISDWIAEQKLTLTGKVKSRLQAPLLGGNLSTLVTLMGTEFEPELDGSFLFLEDTTEPLYRLDRMVQHLVSSRGFRGVKAVVLGDFDGLSDPVSLGLKRRPRGLGEQHHMIFSAASQDLTPLRKTLPVSGQAGRRVLERILVEPLRARGIPVLSGLPVGHAKSGQNALPLGYDTRYQILPSGRLSCMSWGGWTEVG